MRKILDVILFCLTLAHLCGLACALAEMVPSYHQDQQLLVPISPMYRVGTMVAVCRYAGVVLLAIATWNLPSLYRQGASVLTLPISSVFRDSICYLVALFLSWVALVIRLIFLLKSSSSQDGVPYHVTSDDVIIATSCSWIFMTIFAWILYMFLVMYGKIIRYERAQMLADTVTKFPVIVDKHPAGGWDTAPILSTQLPYPLKDKTEIGMKMC